MAKQENIIPSFFFSIIKKAAESDSKLSIKGKTIFVAQESHDELVIIDIKFDKNPNPIKKNKANDASNSLESFSSFFCLLRTYLIFFTSFSLSN